MKSMYRLRTFLFLRQKSRVEKLEYIEIVVQFGRAFVHKAGRIFGTVMI